MTPQRYLAIITIILLISCTNSLKVSTSSNADKNPTKVKQSIAQKLQEHDDLPIKERIAIYHTLRKEQPDNYNFENEDEMTMYGYRHLWNNQPYDALAIFKLIVEQFPESSNPYDSLGEAYLAVGDSVQSLKNYKISLQLNPDNFNAEDQINRILNPHKKPLSPKEKFNTIYNKEEYIADLQQLAKKLIATHPNALKFTSESDFWNLIAQKKQAITSETTYAEFAWHCSEIIAALNCSHSSMDSFYLEREMLPKSLYFPLQTRLINNRLYVIDPYENKNTISIKDEITSINNVSVQQLITDIYKHIQSQGFVETTKRHEFNAWSTILIPYALNFPKSYTVTLSSSNIPVTLLNKTTIEAPYNKDSIVNCENNLCFEIINDNTAVLTISSFNFYPWNNLDVFKKFIDQSFTRIAATNIKNVLIDLRSNGGGSPESSIYLLKYLMDKPFAYFSETDNSNGYGLQQPFVNNYKGGLYFLIDGLGQSTTGHFMAIVKQNKLGTIIGEELGSNHFCTSGQTILRLSNTKLVYFVANSTSKLARSNLKDEQGVLPDYTVSQNIDDYLNEIDTVKKFALYQISTNAK